MISRPTERPYTTALYLLRATQIGLTMADLGFLDIGLVLDIITEAGNDNYDYKQVAQQSDFDKF